MADSNPTRSLDVNAAFMKDIKDDNQHLKELLDKIAPLMQHPSVASNHWTEIISLVGELRDQLAFHFSLEEAYGYFDSALEAEPQRSAEAEFLRSAHPRLFARIRDLTDKASEMSNPDEPAIGEFLDEYAEFFRAFAEHEEAELKLILSTLDDDLGVGD
ncbi:MAG: hemerythrin domain-containing protein [Planctomycetota bacterium]